jgi:hypothetical protein
MNNGQSRNTSGTPPEPMTGNIQLQNNARSIFSTSGQRPARSSPYWGGEGARGGVSHRWGQPVDDSDGAEALLGRSSLTKEHGMEGGAASTVHRRQVLGVLVPSLGNRPTRSDSGRRSRQSTARRATNARALRQGRSP